MSHWLEAYSALRIMHNRIDAEIYNRIRVNLLRERLPWTLPLPAIRCLVCVLDQHAWVCLDACHKNLPIMAWTNFRIAQRKALNAPVDCDIQLYQMHAGLIMGSALEALSDAVAGHARSIPHTSLPVTKLKS
jgi:hypothetical protein